MEITLRADLAAKLHEMAAGTGRDLSQVFEDLIATQIEHDAWFHAEVEKSRALLKAGRALTHEEVDVRMSKYLNR